MKGMSAMERTAHAIRRVSRTKGGFSVSEMIVSVAIMSLVILGVIEAMSAQQRSFGDLRVVREPQQHLRSAISLLTYSISQAGVGMPGAQCVLGGGSEGITSGIQVNGGIFGLTGTYKLRNLLVVNRNHTTSGSHYDELVSIYMDGYRSSPLAHATTADSNFFNASGGTGSGEWRFPLLYPSLLEANTSNCPSYLQICIGDYVIVTDFLNADLFKVTGIDSDTIVVDAGDSQNSPALHRLWSDTSKTDEQAVYNYSGGFTTWIAKANIEHFKVEPDDDGDPATQDHPYMIMKKYGTDDDDNVIADDVQNFQVEVGYDTATIPITTAQLATLVGAGSPIGPRHPTVGAMTSHLGTTKPSRIRSTRINLITRSYHQLSERQKERSSGESGALPGFGTPLKAGDYVYPTDSAKDYYNRGISVFQDIINSGFGEQVYGMPSLLRRQSGDLGVCQ
ncbi:MAG: hypothetical protein GMKNLPBB_00430 [Myxococcota bacterium]|nr:hypothetical protein [Myxococcota bacterium]